jgi:hypothetical protein
VTANPARYRAAERRLWASLGIEPAERQVVLRRLDSSVRVQSVGEGDDVVFLHAVWMDDVHLAATRVRAFLAGDDERLNFEGLLEAGARGA